MRYRLLPLVFVLGLALTACASSGGSSVSQPRVWGAFMERGLSNIPMKPGLNVRVFNDFTLDEQQYIKYDKTTGYFTLEPGTYRIDGWSLTTFGWKLTPEQRAAAYSAPGYAFLWNVEKNDMEILASLQDPLYSLPSNINGVLKVAKKTRYYFGHQNGDKVDGISLQLYDPNIKKPDGIISTNHAFAQLVIERL
ncbi:hypothetical protein [Mycobacterium riyadhense]|uniref:Uncharacterized protein n=1 Tax=Mycobacterium riyadhense TaxID=486698 RepID=A0A653ELZ2_9MYCO|nr:hypothetical protein [Mycobacterium riyadhense]VTO97641.1 hypothetical protein BIN_B_02179 [Mycobacterium riyadhense]